MESHLLDAYMAPALVPTIMAISSMTQLKYNQVDLLYITVSFSTILSSIYALLQFRLNRYTRSRSHLTIITALLLTTTSIVSILGFNLIRNNFPKIPYPKNYELPHVIRNQVPSSPSDVIRYHFFADFIPGFLILFQAKLCSLAQFDMVCRAKRSFTLGEASIVSQLGSAAFLDWAITNYTRLTGAGPFHVHLTNDIVLNIGFIFFFLLFVPSYLFLYGRSRTLLRYILIISSTLVSYVVVQNLIAASNSSLDPIRWLADYIFDTHQRIFLFCIWLSTLLACVNFSSTWARMAGTTNSLVRKVFHLAVTVVFITGYELDLEFARFAAGGLVVIMLILELIRAWQLKPFGKHLEQVCQALRGKWDNKYVTLSHIYLLVGTFIPLWILPTNPNLTTKIALFSGLISVGVGDTAAAFVGTFYGHLRLRSGKTFEGFTGNIIAMILFKSIYIDRSNIRDDFPFFFAAIFTAFIELMTKSCDNLILPLAMLIFLEL